MNETNLVNGKFVGIPLVYPRLVLIHDGHLDIGAFQGDNAASRAPDIAGTQATYLRNNHFCTIAANYTHELKLPRKPM